MRTKRITDSAGNGASGRRGRWAPPLLALTALLALAAPAGAAGTSDGRVYERVSPLAKYGTPAGAGGLDAPLYARASRDGQSVLYSVVGPLDHATRGMQNHALGRRTATGWSEESPLPFPRTEALNWSDYLVTNIQPSADLDSFIFEMQNGGIVPGNPQVYVPAGDPGAQGLYQTSGAGGAVTWLSQPVLQAPFPAVGSIIYSAFYFVGGSQDLKTSYFSYYGTLVPEDAPRAPHVSTDPQNSPKGLYRYSNGHLEAAGVLPDGTVDPYGAIPAGSSARRTGNPQNTLDFRNQVSEDGSRALFVSPDPWAVPASPDAPQLYVRKDDRTTALISKSAVTGLPAEHGVLAQNTFGASQSFAYGARDGSHVYFESSDGLTADAPAYVEFQKNAYLYDVDHDTLTYLGPDVSGDVIAASDDLSRFLYADLTGVPNPGDGSLGLWDHGHAKSLATRALPASYNAGVAVQGRATADGSVFVFQANSPLYAGVNQTLGTQEVYRYEVASDTMRCLSCPPAGVAPVDQPRSGSVLSHYGGSDPLPGNAGGQLQDTRGISTDGKRVFFDTANPLVPRDTNGVRDVYVWEDGAAHLISTGLSSEDSNILDSSASGDDVFFATTEGIDPADVDEEYDVYDARVGGGFPEGVAPPTCASNCRPAATPAAPAAPAATISFAGTGNLPLAARKAVTVSVTKKVVKGRTVTLSVRAPGVGSLSATGAGLRTARRAVIKAGTYRLTLTLTQQARRQLTRKRTLKVRILVRYRPVTGVAATKTVSLTVKA